MTTSAELREVVERLKFALSVAKGADEVITFCRTEDFEIAVTELDRLSAAGGCDVLDAPAKIGATTFGIGVKTSATTGAYAMSYAIKVALVVAATIFTSGFVSYWINLLFQPDAVTPLILLTCSGIGMCGAFIILEMEP